jgi:chorismate-pyruvate lyase
MLQRLGERISYCLARASEAERRAEEVSTPSLKAEYKELANSWRHLARSYQFVEALEPLLLDEDTR